MIPFISHKIEVRKISPNYSLNMKDSDVVIQSTYLFHWTRVHAFDNTFSLLIKLFLPSLSCFQYGLSLHLLNLPCLVNSSYSHDAYCGSNFIFSSLMFSL